MNIANKNVNWYFLAFVIFIAGYSILMLAWTNLAPTDDYVFIHTLQIGNPYLYYTVPPPGYDNLTKMGRLAILGDIEYNLPVFFSKSPAAFWYYLIHVFQYLIVMILLVKILKKFTSNKFLIYATPILLSLFPGIAIAFFRTHMAEKNLLFYYTIFLYFYLKYLEKPKLYYLILGVISAGIAINIKENAFIAVGAFAFFHLVLSWLKNRSNSNKSLHQENGLKIFDSLVLLGCLTYLSVYYFAVYRHIERGAFLYGQVPYNHVLVFIKLLLNYGLFSDPILILIALPFTAWRVIQFLRHKIELHPVYDSMLLAGSMFIMGYLALNMFAPNYLLPAYVFILPPLIYFFNQKEARTIFWKVVAGIAGIALVFNVFPTGIHIITYFKYLSYNFNKTLDFIVKDVNSNHPNQRANMFIDALDPNGGTPEYYIFTEFLQYKGLSWTRFDFKSDTKADDSVPRQVNNYVSRMPFTFYQENKAYKIIKGDYLIITPDSVAKNITPAYIESLGKDYDLVFQTKSPLAFPNINLKTLAKYILASRLTQKQKEEGLMVNENLIESPNYYVFVHK